MPPPGAPSRPGCNERAAFFAANNFTYAQLERPLEASDLCPGRFIYGISVRDPVALAQSHVTFAQARYRPGRHASLSTSSAQLACVAGAHAAYTRDRANGTSEKLKRCGTTQAEPTWHFFDNLLTRTLAGRAV